VMMLAVVDHQIRIIPIITAMATAAIARHLATAMPIDKFTAKPSGAVMIRHTGKMGVIVVGNPVKLMS